MAEYHAISFSWQGLEPNLLYYDREADEILQYDLENLDMNVSHHSTCIGRWHNGGYRPCPGDERVGQGEVCRDCAGDFMPGPACTFEPLCDGELCAYDFCRQEHAVYLAFHGELAKVGMTASRRIGQRMIEQGCDAFSVLALVDGRAAARALEVSLSERLKLRQRIREIESLFCMAHDIPGEGIRARYTEIASEVENIGLRPGPLEFLDSYPLETPLASMPKPTRIEGRHRGEVIGLKGKFLIYENGGLKAINLQRVPGRFLEVLGARS